VLNANTLLDLFSHKRPKDPKANVPNQTKKKKLKKKEENKITPAAAGSCKQLTPQKRFI